MLYDNLMAIAGRAPSTSGLRARGVLHSYPELAERAGRIGAGFAARGIRPGDAVAILLPNGPELFVVAYALFAVGAIAVPLSVLAPSKELLVVARKARIAAIVADEDRAAVAKLLAAELAAPRPLPVFAATGEGASSLTSFAKEPLGRRPAITADTPALYLFSSGSTGIPKVVPHTHGEMLANARATAHDFNLVPDDVVFNNLPGNHAMGFLNSVFEVPEAAASTFYFSDPAPLLLARKRLLDSVAHEGVSILPGIPFMFDALAGVTDAVDLSSVRLVYSAGIGLKRPIFDKFYQRFGLKLRQAYGCTEAGHVAFNRADDPEPTWDSVGRPVGDTVVEVLPSENPLGPEYGELAFRSASLTKGYLGQASLNATAFAGGRFATGDLGRIDADGNVYIKGRSKLIIEIAGHKVDPLEIEEVLGSHPAVAEAVVVGLPDPRTGEQRLKAVVVRQGDTTPDALVRYARERLSAQKVPAIVEFRDAIPKSATGKILRGKLLEE
jgi:long-chain acyl-CoA synthetase